MPTRVHDWMRQAKRDLEHAREELNSGYYEWGCFSAQQSAEKALKSVYQHLHAEAWGHSVKKLLENLPPSISCSLDLFEAGAALDKFYIPTRYPNGFDVGTPEDYYSKKDLEAAIQYAEIIVRFCEDNIREP